MAQVISYNREKAVQYAKQWALGRNPRYLDFSNLGGDCTNFISQCIYAANGIANYTPVLGWYYNSSADRTPSWTGVEYFYNFFTSNTTRGPFASDVDISKMQLGDVIQLGSSEDFYHTLIITQIGDIPSIDNILICAHTINSLMRPLNTYSFTNIRFLHINGVYK